MAEYFTGTSMHMRWLEDDLIPLSRELIITKWEKISRAKKYECYPEEFQTITRISQMTYMCGSVAIIKTTGLILIISGLIRRNENF